MKRVFVYKDRSEQDGKVLAVEESTEVFKRAISLSFNIKHEHINLYTSNSCEIKDIRVIRDGDKIFISNEPCASFLSEDNLEESLQSVNLNKYEDVEVGGWITLNVGGRLFTTTRGTLVMKEPTSMLARMFSNDNNYSISPSVRDANGAYLIDRSPDYFEPILNYLRHGEVILDRNVNPKGVLEEAIFYGIESMVPHLHSLVAKDDSFCSSIDRPLTRFDVVRSIIITPISAELRYQGVNLSGADLNRLDLRNINFKHAILSRCNLTGANLTNCTLERADLSHANLEGAQLVGVKALCANMEGANLKGCNMEDPLGSRAVLEGVNLKGANLEGSNMAGVNLRVATLKHANLQNCVLRTAVLAGANLEYCDLSGSDLHEANLRGANLKDAAFELMLTPLHMSQTIR